jgi:hypothetical protein
MPTSGCRALGEGGKPTVVGPWPCRKVDFREHRHGEVRRIHLLRGWVNKASAWVPSVAVWQDACWKRSVEEGGMSMRRAIVLSVMMAAALVVASGVTHLRFRILQ